MTLLPLTAICWPYPRYCVAALVLTNAGVLDNAAEGITNTPLCPPEELLTGVAP